MLKRVLAWLLPYLAKSKGLLAGLFGLTVLGIACAGANSGSMVSDTLIGRTGSCVTKSLSRSKATKPASFAAFCRGPTASEYDSINTHVSSRSSNCKVLPCVVRTWP